MKKSLFFILVAIMMIAAGCGSVPQADIDATNASVEAAKAAQADIYAPEQLKTVTDSLAVVMQGIETEKSKFMKNFDAYKTQLDGLKAEADKIAAEVPALKEAAKNEATTGLDSLKVNLDAAKQLLAKAPKGKEGKAVLEEISNELSVIETTVTEISTTLAGENVNYKQELDKVNAAQKSVADINTELSEAIAKKAGK